MIYNGHYFRPLFRPSSDHTSNARSYLAIVTDVLAIARARRMTWTKLFVGLLSRPTNAQKKTHTHTHRQTDTHRDTHTQTHTQTHTHTHTHRDTHTETHTHRDTERERHTQRERDRQRERQTQRETDTERETDTDTHRDTHIHIYINILYIWSTIRFNLSDHISLTLRILTFRGRCIVIYFCNKSHRDARFLKFIW